ncbi:ABC transporter permease [Lachnospiraceae bacterium LCP25S3_G4]
MTNEVKKEPLVRVEKRAERTKKEVMLLRLLSVILAIVAGGIFILLIGYNPFSVYGTIVSGAFRSVMAFQATIKIMIPLLIPALGITLAFKMRFWNIGAEGQIIMGGIFATYFALFWWDLPHWLLILLMFIAGAVGGALWGMLPAFFKAKFNTNETLFTLMLNYIALYMISFLRDGAWQDPQSSGFPKIARFGKNAILDKVFGVHMGWIIALVLVVCVYIYLKYTKHGYEISVVGESQATANYAGMNYKKIVIRTMAFSGALAGIAGMIQVSGSDMTLASSVAGGVGFTAIIVAWLAQLNPFGILIVSFLFSILEKGSSVMQSAHGLSTYSADVLQGIILFFVLGCELFVRYRFVFRSKEKGGTK